MLDPFLSVVAKLPPLTAAHHTAIDATDAALGQSYKFDRASPEYRAAKEIVDLRFAVQFEWCEAETDLVAQAFSTAPTSREGLRAYLDLLEAEPSLFQPEHVPALRAAVLAVVGS